MRTFTLTAILILLFGTCLFETCYSQRIYASQQQTGASGVICLNCRVLNPASASDANPQTFSELIVTAGLAAQTYQEVTFAQPAPAGTKVFLKLGTGDALISVQALGGVFLQAYNGNTPVGPAITAASLVTALNNNDQVEVGFTPGAIFNRVRVTLNGGIAGVLASIYFYEAFYNGPGPVACSTPIDELHGISSALLGLGIGGVVNPQLAIDGDINTFSTLNAGVALAGASARQTVIFPALSGPADSVKLTLSLPQALLDAGILSNISVTTYNSDTDNGDTKQLTSALLAVRLLDLNGNRRKVTVSFAPASPYDRVQLRLGGGLANVLSTLDFFEAQRITPGPVISYNGAVAAGAVQVCSGTSVALTASAAIGEQINWYTVPAGGTPIFTMAAFTSPPLNATTTYYAEKTRNGCSDGSLRSAVTIEVIPLPSQPVATSASATICSGQAATLSIQPQNGISVKWYAVASGGAALLTGDTFTTPSLTANTSFYAEAVNASGCSSAARTQVTVIVNPLPSVPVIVSSATNINAGQTVTITVGAPQPGVAYTFYTVATGGAPVFTGTEYTSGPLSANTTFYVEAVGGACISPGRGTVSVTVNQSPTITITPPTRAVNSGQTTTFTASSTTPNAAFNWYTAPAGGTPVFTGPTYTTPAITANATFYADATDPATGAVSVRAAATVTVNQSPTITITPPTRAVNSGQTTTFTASSTTPNAAFNWYTAPAGGTPVFTGPTYTTPAITANATFYADATDPATGAVSARAAATVTVNPSPTIAITPPTRAVNSGQTTTFTAFSTTPNAAFNWYVAPAGGTPVFTGPTYTTPAITANTTFYADATDPATGAVSARAAATVTVNPSPTITITPPTRAVNSGQTTTFTASSTTPNAAFNWYVAPAGGTPVFTGPTYTTPAITANTTFYADATDPATGAVSVRAAATVTVNPAPTITITPPTRAVNSGQTTTFTAFSTTPNAAFNWYTAPAGGTPVFTGPTYTTPAITSNTTFYADATDPATGAVSVRAAATVTVNNAPDITVNPPVIAVNAGQTATFTATSTTPGAIFNWFTVSSGGEPVYSGPTYTTSPVSSNTVYYTEAVNTSTGATSPRASATVNVNNAPNITVTPPSRQVNAGQTTTFTASSTTPGATFNWYTTPVGGTPVFTGALFTTSTINGNTTFYAQATDPASGATSQRAAAVITVNNVPDIAVNPVSRQIDAGATASFTASSSLPGALFNWFTQPAGGAAIFTGALFVSPALNSPASYYAEATDPATGAISGRAAATVLINNIPSVTIMPPSRSVNAGQSTSFNASSDVPGAVITWFDVPAGGPPIYTGQMFTTPAINSNITYYAQASDPATGSTSPRKSAVVTLNNAPDIAVAPPVRNVNAGATATFNASSTTPGAVFSWFTSPSGGLPVFTGPTFTTPPVNGGTTYYAQATDPSTGAISARTTALVVVNNTPDLTITPPTRAVNPGQKTTFTASSTTPGTIYNWYATLSGGSPVFTGPVFTTPVLNTNTMFYAEAVNPGTNATSPRKAATVVVNNMPDIKVTPEMRTIDPGKTASFTATSTTAGAVFKWYTDPETGTQLFTGPVFVTPALTSGTVFYADATDPQSGAVSKRVSVIVAINPVADVAVTPPVQTIAAGKITSFTASSNTPGAKFYWYDVPSGGVPVFTGSVFTTPSVAVNTLYYVEAEHPVSLIKSQRVTASVVIDPNSLAIFVPNAFSPNGDGNNDDLVVYGASFDTYNMRIYNQWGQLIFSSQDVAKTWNGTWRGVLQPVGVYVYYLDGNTTGGSTVKRKGTITLLR